MTIHPSSLILRTAARLHLLIAALLGLAGVTALAAGEKFELPGLATGETAPAFELKDASGKTVTLAELTEQAPVALVFHRSAGWCPFCQRQLMDLQENLDRLTTAGIKLAGISYDSTEVLEQFSRKRNIRFTLLSDVGSKTIDAYGVRNKEADGRAEGIPHPVIFIINGDGRITAKLGYENFRERPTADELIAAVKSTR